MNRSKEQMSSKLFFFSQRLPKKVTTTNTWIQGPTSALNHWDVTRNHSCGCFLITDTKRLKNRRDWKKRTLTGSRETDKGKAFSCVKRPRFSVNVRTDLIVLGSSWVSGHEQPVTANTQLHTFLLFLATRGNAHKANRMKCSTAALIANTGEEYEVNTRQKKKLIKRMMGSKSFSSLPLQVS